MKLPVDKLVIGIGTWKYSLVPSSDIDGNSGLMDPKKREISIDDGLLPIDIAESSLHEVLHAIVEDRPIAGLTDKKEEDVVKVFAPGLIQVFRDNPAWARWILRESRRS